MSRTEGNLLEDLQDDRFAEHTDVQAAEQLVVAAAVTRVEAAALNAYPGTLLAHNQGRGVSAVEEKADANNAAAQDYGNS